MSAQIGAQKRAAARIGVTFEEYLKRLEDGERWCSGHRRWEPRSQFIASKTAPICREAFASYMRIRYATDAGGYRTYQLQLQRSYRRGRITTITGDRERRARGG